MTKINFAKNKKHNMRLTNILSGFLLFGAICCSKPVPPPPVDPSDVVPGLKPDVEVEEPDFGEEVKVLPTPGSSKTYSPSLLNKTYRPVATKYKVDVTGAWRSAEARILPYLGGFDNWKMSRAEYVTSTNKYGSSTTLPKQESTGRFYVKKIGNRFWLVDPYGYLHHHRGLAALRPTNGEEDNAAFIAKYGNRATWATELQEEMASIGFHASGAFATGANEDLIAHNQRNSEKPFMLCPNFNFLNSFKTTYKDLKYCNNNSNTAICFVLDDRWEQFCKDYIADREGSVWKFLNDPNVVGIFSDNEIDFSSTSTKLLSRVLDSGNTEHPAYKAAQAFMNEKGATTVTAELNEEWVGILAEKYYKGIKEGLMASDPKMLYLGSRLHGAPKQYQSIIAAAGKWCDVISINYYSKWSVEALEHVKKWAEWAPDTPFMVTEFYTKGDDSELGNINGAGFIVPTQKDRAYAYQHFALGLLEAKNCVGWHYFKYKDDDTTDNDEPSNKGFYDNNYNLYPWMAEYAKNLNYNVYRLIEYFDN